MAAETVTVLFTDLVGSTELSSRLGPDASDDLRRAHFGLLRGAIADSSGTEVKNLGDGLMVVFTSPSQALVCAVAMQQAIDRHNRQGSEALGIRIGISAGETAVEDGDYFGEPVVEAARLCAKASGGQILLADLVRVMTRGRGHEMIPVGDLELKGLPEPLPTCELAWEPEGIEADAAPIPLPSRVAVPTTIGFVGRLAEREILTVALKAVMSGEGQRVVLISGEGGMGKSTLSFETARDAHGNGSVVLYGRCDEDLGIPYQPIVEALHHYAVHASDEWLRLHDPSTLSELTQLVPAFTKRIPDLPAHSAAVGESELYLLFGAVSTLLAELALAAPTVLILDDVHWADRPTLQLLRVLAGASLGRLLILGTFRDAELSAAHPLTDALGAMRKEPCVERVSLSGLNDNEILAFMETAAGHPMDPSGLELGFALYRETDGNPFYVREVLLHLVETGALVQEGGRWVPTSQLREAGLPESVREVVGARVARLGVDAAAVLAAAAVIGQEFDLDLLCAMTDRSDESVLDELDAAARGGLVAESPTEPGRFRFMHALIQHTIYEDLGPTRQARLHQRAASELEVLCGDAVTGRVGELARHFLAGTRPAELEKAAAYSRQAGDRAMAAISFDEAVRWYSQALDVLGPEGDREKRARCLISLGHAQQLAGQAVFHETLLEASELAEALGDRELAVQAALANNRGFQARTGTVDTRLVQALETALEMVGGEDSTERARLLSCLVAELAADPDVDRRISLASEAVLVARRTGDRPALFDALVRPYLALCTPALAEFRLDCMREALAIIDEVEDPNPTFFSFAYFWLAVTLVELGQLDGVDEAIGHIREVARVIPSPQQLWGLANFECWRCQLSGDLEEAERLANVALELGTASEQPEAFSFYAGALYLIRYFQGRCAELLPLLNQTVEADDTIPALRSALAMGEAQEGDRTHAQSLLDEFIDGGANLLFDANWLTGMLGWAEAAAELDDARAAAVLFEKLRPYPHLTQVGSIVTFPGVAHQLGRLAFVLGLLDDSDRYFAQALEIHERLQAPFHIGCTKVCWALALVDRDPERARGLAKDAIEIGQSRGFADLGRKASKVLNSA